MRTTRTASLLREGSSPPAALLLFPSQSTLIAFSLYGTRRVLPLYARAKTKFVPTLRRMPRGPFIVPPPLVRPGPLAPSILASSYKLRRLRGFAHPPPAWSTPDRYAAFSPRLTTEAPLPQLLGWFDRSSSKARSKGPPSSLASLHDARRRRLLDRAVAPCAPSGSPTWAPSASCVALHWLRADEALRPAAALRRPHALAHRCPARLPAPGTRRR